MEPKYSKAELREIKKIFEDEVKKVRKTIGKETYVIVTFEDYLRWTCLENVLADIIKRYNLGR